MFVAILTIFIGAVFTAAGVQEMVVQGIFNTKAIPLAGALLLSGGMALLRQSPRATALTRAAAVASLPVFVLIGKIVLEARWMLMFFRTSSAKTRVGQA